MDLKDKKIGFAMCGSFCTFKKALVAMQAIVDEGAEVIPIMSEISYNTNTRFGEAEYFQNEVKKICGKDIIKNVKEAEPIGPRALLDLLIVLPCTGNSLAKIANGITDTSVTMAVKAHLRNQRPVLIAVSTNDGLGAAAKNIGSLLNYKNIYFVPLAQDDYVQKPTSLIADFEKIIPAARDALDGKQLQPILVT